MITPQELSAAAARIRAAQLEMNKLIGAKAIPVPVHLALGHEAIAAAVAAVVEPQDKLLCTHRNIHYHLALGATVDELAALYHTPMGSMNCTRGQVVYSTAILGNNLPVAIGVAMANRITHRHAVTWAITGDGALEEGAFHESLLLASSLNLPIVFIIENNDHSLAASIKERRCAVDLNYYAKAFGYTYSQLQTNSADTDATDCYASTLKHHRLWAYNDQRPSIVEVFIKTLGADGYHAGYANKTEGL